MLNHIRVVFLGVVLILFSQLANAAGFKDFSDNPSNIENYTKNGKWTVLMIWASDCHVCNMEISQYVALHQRNQENNIQVLGLSVDGMQKKTDAENFIRRHNVNFQNLWAEPEYVSRFYNTQTGESWVGTPTFLVYAPDGSLKAQRAGVLPAEIIENFIQQQSK